MTVQPKGKPTHKEIAKMILDKKALEDYRVMNDCPFMGILIGCQWDFKEDVKEAIYEALEAFVTE